jgi:hypothetical protein
VHQSLLHFSGTSGSKGKEIGDLLKLAWQPAHPQSQPYVTTHWPPGTLHAPSPPRNPIFFKVEHVFTCEPGGAACPGCCPFEFKLLTARGERVARRLHMRTSIVSSAGAGGGSPINPNLNQNEQSFLPAHSSIHSSQQAAALMRAQHCELP